MSQQTPTRIDEANRASSEDFTMADKAPRSPDPTQPVVRVSKKTTIPASAVGVTLTISEKALAELDRIQEETIQAEQEGRKFFWR